MNTNEEVVEEEEEVVEETTEETPKSFEDLSDDDIANMSDEDMIKLDPSNKDAEEDTGEPEEETDTAPAEEEVKKDDDEFVKSEEYQRYNKNEKGLYHKMKEERKARQEYERKLHETELERERLKAQNEVQQKFFERKSEVPTAPVSELVRVKQDITAKAQAYEQEYGEPYRLSINEYEALEQAKQSDLNRSLQEWQAKEAENKRVYEIQSIQERATQAEKELMATEEYSDYGYVFKTFVEPLINPNINPNRAEAEELAATLITAIKHGKNAAKYAYEHIATLTDEGRKYFRDKSLKSESKKLINGDKKITKTSAHYTGAKPSSGKSRVTAEMVTKDESWYSKLTDDQIMRIGAGEDVYV